MFPAST
jgi:hypothetical protein